MGRKNYKGRERMYRPLHRLREHHRSDGVCKTEYGTLSEADAAGRYQEALGLGKKRSYFCTVCSKYHLYTVAEDDQGDEQISSRRWVA